MQAYVLIIAPHNSYRLVPYIKAAHGLNYSVLIASQARNSLVTAVAEGVQIDLKQPQESLEKILALDEAKAIRAVIGTDDDTVGLAALIAARLGLAHNHPEAAEISKRKDLARQCLQQAAVSVPAFQRIPLETSVQEQALEVAFPCVIKPLCLSGSRGVMRADSVDALEQARQRLVEIVHQEKQLSEHCRTHALIEQFIPGAEVAVEGILHEGKFEVITFFDKPDPLEGPFFEETYYISPSRHSQVEQQWVIETIQSACKAYGLSQGPVHAELRLHAGRAWIIELAARTIGGQCAKLLQFAAGHGLEELVISYALGRPLALDKRREAVGVLMIPIPKSGILRRVEGIRQAQAVQHIQEIEISVREGYELVPLPEGASYLGFIFARAATPEQVETALREAHAHLRIVVAPILPLQLSF